MANREQRMNSERRNDGLFIRHSRFDMRPTERSRGGRGTRAPSGLYYPHLRLIPAGSLRAVRELVSRLYDDVELLLPVGRLNVE